MLRTTLFLLSLASTDLPAAEPAAGKSVEAPPKVQPGETIHPEVTITEGKDKTITEYRIAGQIRAIKIQPKGGKPYYLVDREGSGQFQRFGPDMGPNLEVPRWVLMEW
ncbi:MAG: DUF2782 domain-containing protein [Gammaproteobacteria bacterium]|nr:DUF2782 domain-containing protein [Gammaproteobacteria bacterium]